MMFLKHRYRLGYETLCRDVADSISWSRFCRIPLGTTAPHPSTLGKITARCGPEVVDQLNKALLVRAAGAKVVKLDKVRADTTVVEANVAYPTAVVVPQPGLLDSQHLLHRPAGDAPVRPVIVGRARRESLTFPLNDYRYSWAATRRADEAPPTITGEVGTVTPVTGRSLSPMPRGAVFA
jgi:hypothetical protein